MPVVSLERWQVLSEHLSHALELPERERTDWLAALERQDAEMAALVARALAVREHDGFADFLAGPAVIAGDEPAAPVLVGRVVGAYVVDAEIGRGGMGSVWRARRADGRVEGSVAIKFLHPSWLSRDGEARFRQEGNLLARLDHPNIARLIDAGILDETHPYLVIEYVDGLPIDEYCARERLATDARVRLYQSVLAAVGYAHSHLIVHRDIKPSNVFVTRCGAVKLLDFGIAKLLDDGSTAAPRTRGSVQALTPQYAAPEQLLGRAVTTKTDVYALGVLLYLLLTGHHPVRDDDSGAAGLVHAIVEQDPLRPSLATGDDIGLRRALEGDLDNILARALKKQPAERYASVGAFNDDLRRYLSHEPVTAGPDTALYRTSKFVRRHRGAVAAAVLTALAVICATVVTTAQWLEARRQRDMAQAQLQRAQGFSDLASIVLSESGASGEALTTAQLLERGERLVRTEFAATDQLRAELLYTLARLYSQVGATDKQRDLYRESHGLATRSGDAALIARSGCAAAAADAVTGVAADARQRIDQYLAALPRGPDNDDARASCWLHASTVAAFTRDGAASLAAAETADRLLAARTGGTQWDHLSTAIMLADAQSSAGELRTADATYARVAEQFKRIGVNDSAFAATLYNNWGIVLTNLGMPRRAAEQLAHVMAIDRGFGTPDAFASTVYAAALLPLGRGAEARDVLGAALERALAQGNRMAAAMVQMALARVYSELGDGTRSDQILAALEPVLTQMLPPGHEAFGALHLVRAQNSERRGNHDAALPEVDLALAVYSSRPGLAHRAAAAQELKAQILLGLGRPDAARAQIEKAKDAYERISGAGSRSYYVGRAWLTEAQIDAQAGDRTRSRAAAQQAYSHLAATIGDTEPLTLAAAALTASQR